jgi:hypothetical protein
MLQRILKILTVLGGIAFIVVGTMLLVAFGRGYSYDFRNHRPTLNGLVVMSSTPGNATILQNGKDIKRKTPYRATLEAGEYSFEVNRDGYQTWRKRVRVVASEVSWLQYIWLLPTNLHTSVQATHPTVASLQPSKDHRHFAYITTGTDGGVWLMVANNPQTSRIYTPKLAEGANPAETLVDLTWAADNQHMLLHSIIGSTNRYQIINANPSTTSIDLTANFKFDFSGLQFNPSNWKELFWLSPDGLRKLDVDAQTVSYNFAGDRVLYVQTTKLGKSLYSMDKAGKDKKEVIQSLAESPSYQLSYVTYKGTDELAVLPTQARTITLYTDIYGNNPTSQIITKDADLMLFNADGRFLTYSTATTISTFDLEKNDFYKVVSDTPIGTITWFDNYHLLNVRKGELHWSEFDGGNDATLSQIAPGTAAYATSDQKGILFPFVAGAAKTELHQIDMKQ